MKTHFQLVLLLSALLAAGGGHVLEFSAAHAVMELDRSLEFRWLIPDTAEYQEHNF